MSDKVYFISVPSRVAALDIPASHKMVAGSIFTRTTQRDKEGFVKITQRFIMEDWGIQETAITSAIKWLKENGFIQTKRTRYGTLVKWVGCMVEDVEDTDSITPENKVPEKQGSRKTGVDNPEKQGFISPKNGVALLDCIPRLIPKTEEGEGTYDSATDSLSETVRTKLPASPSLSISAKLTGMINLAFPSNPNAVLHQIRMAGWDERRVEAALVKTDPSKGVNYFASICRRMTDAEVNDTLKAPEAGSAKPERVTTRDGRKVLKNGVWLDVATPYPNQPPLRAARPVAAVDDWRPPVETPEEQQARIEARKVADEAARARYRAKVAAEEQQWAETAKTPDDIAQQVDLLRRRAKRKDELKAKGVSAVEILNICRAEGLLGDKNIP